MARHDPCDEPDPTRRPAELPPSQQLLEPHPANRVDVRGRVLGIQEAAKLVGYGRTQMWRDARDGKVKSIVEGTAARPVYRFFYEDLIEYKQQRDRQKEMQETRKRRRSPKSTQPLLRAISILDILTPKRSAS